MKRMYRLLAGVLLTMLLCGCSGLTGGHQIRNMASYIPVMTDGEQSFFEAYTLPQWKGYFQIQDGTFVLSERPYPDDTLWEAETDTRLVMDAQRTGIMQDLVPGLAPEDAFLEDGFWQLMDEEPYFACRIYEEKGEYYGILNCYRRCAGRSGAILAFEDLKYSRLLTVENDRLVFSEPMKKTALLASNSTHYIAYQDKTILSVCKATGEQRQIMKDLWWSTPSEKYYVNFCQTENVFCISGRRLEKGEDIYALYACYIDGSGLQLLREERE